MALAAIRAAPITVAEVAAQEERIIFKRFTAQTAWNVGCLIRERLKQASQKAAVVNIALANGEHLLFHAASGSGTGPDNDTWVARKRRTVLRWSVSTYSLALRYKSDEAAFASKFQLGPRSGEYAIHGGGFPVRVAGVESIVAVIVVSGLTMQEDHEVIVEVLEEYLRQVESGEIKD